MRNGSENNGWEWNFFEETGPKLLIVRNGKVWYLGSAFTLVIKKDKNGKIIDCRFRYQHAEKGDKVFWWHDTVYRNYPKYSDQRGCMQFD